MNRYKMTNVAKAIIFVLIVSILGGGVFLGYKSGLIKPSAKKTTQIVKNKNENTSNKSGAEITSNDVVLDSSVINISLDEWIG